MGRIVDYSQVLGGKDGVSRLPITNEDMKQVAAEFVRVETGSSIEFSSPPDCDGYWFTLRGVGHVTSGDVVKAIKARSFVAVEGGKSARVTNEASEPLELIQILAPAPGGPGVAGFKGGVSVTNFDEISPVFEEDSKKRRFFYVGTRAAMPPIAHRA